MHTYIIALLALGVAAAPANSVSTSVSSQQTCITRLRPAFQSIASIPTSIRTSAQTKSKTVTISAAAGAQKTKTVTPSTVTSTVVVTASDEAASAATSSSTSTVYLTVTQSSNATSDACSSTTTVTGDGTSTVYTGTYSAPAAKRTAAAQDISPFEKRQNPFAEMITHRFGQPVGAMMSRQAFEVDCLDRMTTYHIVTSTVSASTHTTTITGSTPILTVTQSASASKAAASSSAAEIIITTTSTVTLQATGSSSNITSAAAALCTVTTGHPTATTTQHIKCAPTNLIGSANGYGIAQTQGRANETEGLTDGSDPSACCQTCVDTDGCAASSDDQGAGNCFLFYTTPSCGLAFSYTDGGEKLAMGSGLLVQTGCGSVQAVAAQPIPA